MTNIQNALELHVRMKGELVKLKSLDNAAFLPSTDISTDAFVVT